MKTKLLVMGMVISLLVLAPFTSGCTPTKSLSEWVSGAATIHDWASGTVEGVGRVSSAEGAAGATFSIRLHHNEAGHATTGAFEYVDSLPWEDKTIRLHGLIDGADSPPDDDRLVFIRGTYAPDHPATPGQTGGHFIIAIRAEGCDGVCGREDPTFSVRLDQGVYDGYECGGYWECGGVAVGTTP